MRNTKRICALLLVLFLVMTCLPFRAEAAGGVPVDADHFPDKYFRDFIMDEIYYARDGYLSASELSKITSIYFITYSDREYITDMTGIEYFTALTGLYCDNASLTSLDLSKNTALVELSCYKNQITSLNIANCTKLEILSCSNNQLTELDVSHLPNLKELTCSGNQLTSLDVSNCTALIELMCSNNQLTSLDVSKCTALEVFYCHGNQLSSLDVSNNIALVELSCGENLLTSLDVSKCPGLETFYCHECQLTSLDVSNNTALKYLYCHGNQLTKLDVKKNTALWGLTCGDNQLTSLDVSRNTELKALACSNNPLTELDVRKNTALGLLYLDGCQLTSLDLNQNTALTKLKSADNSYYIILDGNGQFDLNTLPGNFDLSKASNWAGGSVSGNILTPESETITYTYQMGDSWTETFTLRCNPDPQSAPVRIAGSHRWATAIEVANQLKASLGAEKFDSIIIASGMNFADALAGSYLATVKNAPILLSWGQGGQYAYLDEDNIAYIKANLAENGTVYILGSEDAVPGLYEDALAGYTIKRLGGKTRFDTNLLILQEAGVNEGDEILVCTSTNFADSLSASAVGKPILLVFNEVGELYGDQSAFLASLNNCTFTIIGGENAVCAELENAISAYGTTTRLAGADRFETSVLVARKYFSNPDTVVLAYAWNYPDGLCGGPLSYAIDAPLVLTMNSYESQAAAYVQEMAIRQGYVLGSGELISDSTVRTIFAITATDEVIGN